MFMERLCKLIAQISMFISASCAGVLTVVMILQIFCRKVLNNSLSWSDEMGGYLLVWIALYGAVTALYEHKHLAIDAIVNKMSIGAQQKVRLIVNCLVTLFLMIIFYYSLPLMTQLSGMTAVSLPIPRSVIYSPLLITSVFSIVLLINDILQDVKIIMDKKGGIDS